MQADTATATWHEVASRPYVRRGVVTAAAVFCLQAALLTSGVVGGRSITGPLETAPSLLTPSAPGYRIWWVAYALLLAYAVWQWLPAARDEPRTVASAWPAAGALFLTGLWPYIAQADRPGVPVAVLLLIVCLALALRAVAPIGSTLPVRLVTQVPFALTLGWVTVVLGGAVAHLLEAWGVPALWVGADVWAVLAVTGLLGLGMAFVRYFPGRLFTGLGLAWGFGWVAHGRLLDTPRSYPTGIVAVVASLLILVAAIAVFLWARSRARH